MSSTERKTRYNAIKLLRKDLKQWEQKSKVRALENCQVVLGKFIFDLYSQ